MTEKKPKKKYVRIIEIISDIITIPFLILSVLTAFTMYNAKKNGYVPSLFGKSIVTVVSGSMIASGFEIGDTAVVNTVDPGTLVVGDIIAFYAYVDPNNKPPASYISTTHTEGSGLDVGERDKSYSSGHSRAAEAGSRVWFHEIVGIGMDERGLWFQTKGSSNLSVDANWIFEDFIVGKYIEGSDSPLLRETLSFMSSRLGIIIFAIIPSGISLILDTLSLIELVDQYMAEKRKKYSELAAQQAEAPPEE
ncbi:MAG: hypothetical protein WCR30_05090 [Clostridia bacterium]